MGLQHQIRHKQESAPRPSYEEPVPSVPVRKPGPKKAGSGKAPRASPQSIRFPQEVLDFFGYRTPGWQKRINDVLQKYVAMKGKK